MVIGRDALKIGKIGIGHGYSLEDLKHKRSYRRISVKSEEFSPLELMAEIARHESEYRSRGFTVKNIQLRDLLKGRVKILNDVKKTNWRIVGEKHHAVGPSVRLSRVTKYLTIRLEPNIELSTGKLYYNIR